ncbi:hypothetical protein Nepgr_000135 [Nepenthes gracilis]|uniref:Uncharacterized protein n=1 Tax=Nepenthes gracilis TaxID=150966 RepID=A0AAD3RW65_NEPGR|nr:hypothetical protein Nepgr_000135 [Nepenthes gracilis]
MEHCTGLTDRSRYQKYFAAESITTYTGHSSKLRDFLMSDKPPLSYADFHHWIKGNNGNTIFESLRNQQSLGTKNNAAKHDEKVRYTSNVPRYLEKGKSFQEKQINVGVLNRGHQEKGQYDNRQMPQKKKSSYNSTSSGTSFFPPYGSFARSSRDQSCSPARQRMHHRFLQSHLEVSPRQKYSQDAKTYPGSGHNCSPAPQNSHCLIRQPHHPKPYPLEFNSQKANHLRETPGKFQEPPPSIDNNLLAQRKLFGINKTPSKIQSDIKLERCERKQSDSKFASEIEKWRALNNYEVATPWKGKFKTQDRESSKKVVRFQELKANISDQDCSERHETVVLPLPRDCSENIGVAHPSDLSTANARTLAVSGRKNFSETSYCDEVHGSSFCNNNNRSCKLSSRDGSEEDGETRGSYSSNGVGVKVSSQPFRRMPHYAKMVTGPSRSNTSEEKKPNTVFKSTSEIRHSAELDSRTASESSPKARNPSPIRRISHGIASIIRNVSSRENSPQRRSTSRSGSERAAASVSNNSCGDKLHDNNRARISPLRRLLDPLIKPKGPHCLHPSEHFKKDSKLAAGPCKSSDERVHLPDVQSVELKRRLTSGRTSFADDSDQNSKHGSSSFHALLQVAVKNGLPLFTFAIDSRSDILAATLRKSSSPEKNHYSWIYTFFTIHEIKRKNGIWLNQGVKANDHGYVPNVIAQMKVSDPQFPACAGHKNMDGEIMREFSLFSVDSGQSDYHAAEFHPTNELAAIVIRLLKTTTSNPSKGGQPSCNVADQSKASAQESVDDSENGPSVNQSVLSATIVLPGGIHSVPSKRAISTLTQRWKSGGSCDCGGWDLGCQLRIYTNQNELEKKSSSCKTCCARDEFKLFSQVGQDYHHPVLSLARFKESIYSVEFGSAISVLQAFAISMAVLDCRRPLELSELSNLFREITPG